MELLHEPRTARKILLLEDCQTEVLVLTSPALVESWPAELVGALKECAKRGLDVKLLVEASHATASSRIMELEAGDIDVRQTAKKFRWLSRAMPVQGETWIFDRQEVITVNKRLLEKSSSTGLTVECLLGRDVAHGASAFFDHRWKSATLPLAYSVRHKQYAFHSGQQAEHEFFVCLLAAKKEVSICLPGSRVSKRVENALHRCLGEGVQVTIFANAESDDAPALKRLRRLSGAGAVVKICGRRLTSECAVVDGTSVYMGTLPNSWNPWARTFCPVFVLTNNRISQEILAALETQVSVEIKSKAAPSSYAFR